jgi:DNA transposition AAA+ family ATPase
MALSSEQRRKLLERELPNIKAVRAQLQDYMERTGLQTADMARRINYSTVSLYHFMQGRYDSIAGTSAQIRAAIVDFIAAYPIKPITESDGKLYETENVRLIRETFYQALEGRRAYYFRGAPGSQKSFVLQHLIAELNCAEISKNGHGRRAFYVYCPHRVRPTQLMKEVAIAAGSIPSGDVRRIIRNIRFDLNGRKALFVFDEAQHLDVSCLETVRELLDMPPRCGLLFAGSHEIEKTFNRLDMNQLHDRIRKGRELPGLSEEEAGQIIRGELGDVKQPKVDALVKQCYQTDMHKGRDVKYISARLLFFALQAIQERKAVKGANA